MVSLANHTAAKFAKMLFIGDSGSGKSGALVSLVLDGYKLRILDLDNGLDSLREWAKKEGADLNLVDYETRRDKYKIAAGKVAMDGTPKAFTQSMELLTKWSDGTIPAEWGERTVLVIDSLSALGKAAFEWARHMSPGVKDPRQWYGAAQDGIEDVIALITSEAFQANVIVISHIRISEFGGLNKGYANAIGQALGPILPRYFNTMIQAESQGSGVNVKRQIKTLPTGIIELKTPAPFKIDAALPLGTGLATIFKALKD
jgi:hypothetical protein